MTGSRRPGLCPESWTGGCQTASQELQVQVSNIYIASMSINFCVGMQRGGFIKTTVINANDKDKTRATIIKDTKKQRGF